MADKNLLAAMAMEEEYRTLRLDWEAKTTYGYVEKLKAFGFADTVEYEHAKNKYYFENIPVARRIEPFGQAHVLIPKAVSSNTPTIFFFIPEEPMVCVATDYDIAENSLYDADYCTKNNIPVVPFPRNGGVFICSPDDVAIIYYNPYIKDAMSFFREKIQALAKQWAQDVVFEKNDILVNGYKVAGFASIAEGKGVGIYITFSIDINLVNKICGKPTEKIPRGLGKLSRVTRDAIITEVESWLLLQ